MKIFSIPKFEDGLVNEDAVLARDSMIAVSDGAGGGGLFADKWSKYLVEHLPDEPIGDYPSFDKWIDGIWEPFYNECEKKAEAEGGMLLNKFYDEGSFATLVAVWDTGQWMSYGDSVAFCYDRTTGRLQHSFGRIADFNKPPYLVNCKDPTDEKGFRSGRFETGEESVVFAASDALAHYILMMYEVAHRDEFADELQEAIDAQTKNSNFIRAAMRLKKLDFEEMLMNLLGRKHKGHFKQHLKKFYREGLLGYDDYSLVIM